MTLPSYSFLSLPHLQQVKVWDLSASTSFVAKVGASMHPAEIRAMAIFPGTGRIAVGYMGNEECTEIRVWDVAQGGIPAGEGAKPTEVPPLWSVPGHDDTVVSLGVLGENGLVFSGFDRTVSWKAQARGGLRSLGGAFTPPKHRIGSSCRSTSGEDHEVATAF